MCTIHAVELKLISKTLNQYHAKCMRFTKIQFVSYCYTAVLYEPIFKFTYTKTQPYIFPTVGLRFCFCKIKELRSPTNCRGHYQ